METNLSSLNIEALIVSKMSHISVECETSSTQDIKAGNEWEQALSCIEEAFGGRYSQKDAVLKATVGVIKVLGALRGGDFDLQEMLNTLIAKNRAYGNSLFEPARVASDISASARIAVQYDCKVNRLKKGREFSGDDTLVDLVGYGVMWLICLDLESAGGADGTDGTEEFIEYRCPVIIVCPRVVSPAPEDEITRCATYAARCIEAVSAQGFVPVAPCVFLPNDENYMSNCASLSHDLRDAGAFVVVFSDLGVCEGMVEEVLTYELCRHEEMHDVVTTTLEEFSAVFSNESEDVNERESEQSSEPGRD